MKQRANTKMAHAVDNRNFTPVMRNSRHSNESLSSMLPTERSQTHCPVSSSTMDQQRRMFHLTSANPQQFKSTAPYHSTDPCTPCSLSSSAANDSPHRPPARQQQTNYQQRVNLQSMNPSSNAKHPPTTRMSKVISTTNDSYIQRAAFPLSDAATKLRINTTYLNSTQLYISQPSRDAPPPPPPPRQPLQPPVIPPRNLSIRSQKSSILIPDFSSSPSIKTTSQPIYRAPAEVFNGEGRPYHPSYSSTNADNDSDSSELSNDSLPNRDHLGECGKCGETITSSDDPCDILGRNYHSSCAVCVLCGRSVKNKHFYLKDQLYCEEDFLYTGFYQGLEHCVICGHLISDTILQALGQSYHSACFKCSHCSMCLDGVPFSIDKDRNLFCLHDYHVIHGPRCDHCSHPILPEEGSNETVRIISMGRNFHIECYRCEECLMQLSDEQHRRCYPLDERLLCEECCHRQLNRLNHF